MRTALCLLVAMAALSFPAAAAAAAAPTLKVTSSMPEFVKPGRTALIYVSIQNVGTDPLSGDLILKYTMPDGVAAVEPMTYKGAAPMTCQTLDQVVECVVDVTGIQAGTQIRYRSEALIDPGASGTLSGQIEVSGGGTVDHEVLPMSFIVGAVDPFAVKLFDVEVGDAPALPSTRAGSHPSEVLTEIGFPSQAEENLDIPGGVVVAPKESFRDTVVHAPPGFVGNPTATETRCTPTQLATPVEGTSIPSCPLSSQVGTVQIAGGDIAPLYNVQPAHGEAAEFGFYYQVVVVTLAAKVRPEDFGIDVVSLKAPNSIPIPAFSVSLWGVPGDDAHDPERGICLEGYTGYNPGFGPCPLQAERVPFLRSPTSCPGTPLQWGIDVNTYQHPETWVHGSTTTPAIEGCRDNPFKPDLSLAPSVRSAHAPSGLDATVSMSQDWGPDGVAPADVKRVSVTLPKGIGVNPSSADGLGACADSQLRLGLDGPAQCPESSKIGSLEVRTPLLDEALPGSVYLRTQNSQDPASGQMFRLALVLHSEERGLDIKLPGALRVDPTTGQLTTEFSDLPQLPFEALEMHLKAGPRAPLATPSVCGTYSSHVAFTSWGDKTVELDVPFTVDQDCAPAGFTPGFQAGAQSPVAGDFSPFTLRVTRDAAMPNLSRIDATLPEGLLAKLAGVPLCPDAQAAGGECPDASRIGRVLAGIGEGSAPLYLPQPGKSPTAVYLAGPYKGAPYSVVAAVPAQAGPFDLGTVSVRSALRVDPETTRVTVASDPLPQIHAGIPVSYRDVRVEVDRPRFTINPTSCEPMQVVGSIGAVGGTSADVSDRFQVADCAALGFKPKLAISLRGKTRRAGNPALTAMVTFPGKGDKANIARVQVALPEAEFLAQDHIRTVCTRVQYAARNGGGAQCPKSSVYGRATAWSPLLDHPLSGPVYLRSSNHPLPDLVASLGGQIHVDLVGRIDSDKRTGGLRTTFGQVPDAPVSKFVLKMPGGKKSLLENSTNICRGTHRAKVKFDGQNGKIADFNPALKVKGCGKAKAGRK